jgi:hypothetical protein
VHLSSLVPLNVEQCSLCKPYQMYSKIERKFVSKIIWLPVVGISAPYLGVCILHSWGQLFWLVILFHSLFFEDVCGVSTIKMLGHYLKIGQHSFISLLDVTSLPLSAVAQEWDHKLSVNCHSVFEYTLIMDKICSLKVFLKMNQCYTHWLHCSYSETLI